MDIYSFILLCIDSFLYKKRNDVYMMHSEYFHSFDLSLVSILSGQQILVTHRDVPLVHSYVTRVQTTHPTDLDITGLLYQHTVKLHPISDDPDAFYIPTDVFDWVGGSTLVTTDGVNCYRTHTTRHRLHIVETGTEYTVLSCRRIGTTYSFEITCSHGIHLTLSNIKFVSSTQFKCVALQSDVHCSWVSCIYIEMISQRTWPVPFPTESWKSFYPTYKPGTGALFFRSPLCQWFIDQGLALVVRVHHTTPNTLEVVAMDALGEEELYAYFTTYIPEHKDLPIIGGLERQRILTQRFPTIQQPSSVDCDLYHLPVRRIPVFGSHRHQWILAAVLVGPTRVCILSEEYVHNGQLSVVEYDLQHEMILREEPVSLQIQPSTASLTCVHGTLMISDEMGHSHTITWYHELNIGTYNDDSNLQFTNCKPKVVHITASSVLYVLHGELYDLERLENWTSKDRLMYPIGADMLVQQISCSNLSLMVVVVISVLGVLLVGVTVFYLIKKFRKR